MKKPKVRQTTPNVKTTKAPDAKGAFSRVFTSQQRKVNTKKEVSNLLTQFAEDDLKRIAVMIQKWLEKDAREKAITSATKSKKR